MGSPRRPLLAGFRPADGQKPIQPLRQRDIGHLVAADLHRSPAAENAQHQLQLLFRQLLPILKVGHPAEKLRGHASRGLSYIERKQK